MSEKTELQVRHQTVMDDETRHVSRVYADALYRAAEKNNVVEDVRSELDTLVNEVFRKDPGFELFFASASVGRERKKAAIDATFTNRSTPVFVHFLEVLNNHERLEMLRGIANAFRAIYERRKRMVEVDVRSAVPLTEEEKNRIRADVKAVSGFEPILKETVDPEILGGLIVRVQDWVYDASVRTRLQAIRTQLIERSSHAIQSGRDRFRS